MRKSGLTSKGQTLAIRWLVIATRKRSEREMSAKLAAELIDAYNSTGGAVKKKEDTHRMFTSRTGIMLFIACSKISIASLPSFSLIILKAS